MKYKILLVTGADVDDPRSRIRWSGTPYYCGLAIRKIFQVMGRIIIDAVYKKYKNKHLLIKPDFTLFLGVLNPGRGHRPFAIYFDDAISRCFRKGIKAQMAQKSYDNAIAIFTFSEFARRLIIKEYGVAPSKIVNVGAGPNLLNYLPFIDTKKFDGKTILFVGRQVKRKGGLVLFEAFKKIKHKVPDARLIMISRDAYKYNKQRKSNDYDVTIYGSVDKQVLGYWYRRASVFTMPSLFEPFGIVFLEAMAYKLPCIGTNICAMPEIIDNGRTGFLVKPGDADELAEKIVYLLRNKEESRRMGELGRKKIEQYYSWVHAVKRIEKHMGRVLSRR